MTLVLRPRHIGRSRPTRLCGSATTAASVTGGAGAGSGKIAEFSLPSPSSEPHGITMGADGALWVALETGEVARLERFGVDRGCRGSLGSLLAELSWGWRMPSMRAVLEGRQKAAAVLVEELGAELERVRLALADAEDVLRRRVIGLEQYLEALAQEDAPSGLADGVSPARPVGPRRAVRHRQNAAGVEGLSVDYQTLMAAAVEAGDDGLGARRAALVLGWDSASASRVEGARARLKRLAA
ncbi:hypothetical protein QFZ74_000619 [Streptomyces sp. V3I7]|nr:hypothetical protein [Streptomyces sp. V3I7]